MANKPVEALIRCPFFQQEEKNMISCEGYAPGTCMITKFADAAAKRAHLKRNCYSCTGGACFMARSLLEKYETKDAAETAERVSALHAQAEALRGR